MLCFQLFAHSLCRDLVSHCSQCLLNKHFNHYLSRPLMFLLPDSATIHIHVHIHIHIHTDNCHHVIWLSICSQSAELFETFFGEVYDNNLWLVAHGSWLMALCFGCRFSCHNLSSFSPFCLRTMHCYKASICSFVSFLCRALYNVQRTVYTVSSSLYHSKDEKNFIASKPGTVFLSFLIRFATVCHGVPRSARMEVC